MDKQGPIYEGRAQLGKALQLYKQGNLVEALPNIIKAQAAFKDEIETATGNEPVDPLDFYHIANLIHQSMVGLAKAHTPSTRDIYKHTIDGLKDSFKSLFIQERGESGEARIQKAIFLYETGKFDDAVSVTNQAKGAFTTEEQYLLTTTIDGSVGSVFSESVHSNLVGLIKAGEEGNPIQEYQSAIFDLIGDFRRYQMENQ